MTIDPFYPVPSVQSFKGPREWRTAPGKGLLICLCSLSLASLGAQEGKFTADFEVPAYQLGSIHGQHGWVVDQGKAEVTAAAGRGGSAGLVLTPSSPFSWARLTLQPGSGHTGVSFVDLYIRPVAGVNR